MGLNRNEKEVQVGHSFNIRFKMKVVNDNIEHLDESDKRKGYNLKHAKNGKKLHPIGTFGYGGVEENREQVGVFYGPYIKK